MGVQQTGLSDMAIRPQSSGKATDHATTGNAARLQHALDPLSALLKGAGLRRSEPDAAASKPSPKRKTAKKAAAKRRAAQSKRSPLAVDFPHMPTVAGVRLGAVASGVKYRGRRDLMIAHFAPGTTVAGVFTQSKTAAAPVIWCRKAISNEDPEAGILVVNAGNANAFTGKAGDDAVKDIASTAAKAAGCRQRDVFIASTGVIGEPLPVNKITSRLPSMVRGTSPRTWSAAAEAIMTTDTFPKGATRTAKIEGLEVKINGIAKGSGMIAPDMATMLGFIFTDAAVPAHVLQSLLLLGARDSFNAITVDSDTSTSDTVLCFATGQVQLERPITGAGDRRLADFRRKLHDLMRDLALQIVRDGEGATKLVKIVVSGAASTSAARTIAMSIANSPLVKTAIAGEDPNWGRIVMAVGKAGEAADRDKLKIVLNELPVAAKGQIDPDYVESKAAATMKEKEICIEVDVGVGRGTSTIWTCDLTQRYIAINADYRS
jgi:glutamate N-acetyltransferase/amino-acid N-acetyltransferase